MIEYEYEYEYEEESLVSQHEEAVLNDLPREEIGIQTNIQYESPWHDLFKNQTIIDEKILELHNCENRLGWVQTMLIIILFCMAIFFYGRCIGVW